MKKLLFVFGAIIMLAVTSCIPDETQGTIDLVFEATYGEDILTIGKEYEMLDGRKFIINRSDFFLSDVKLIADDGSEKVLFDYIQVDLTDAPGGKKFDFDTGINEGNYESLKFNLGLNPTLNATSPVDYEASSVLNNSGYYWAGWDSYIFSKTEGKVADANGDLTEAWIFHTGMDDMLRPVTVNIDKEILNDANTEIRISFDHEPLFQKDGEAISLGINHDPNLATLNEFIDRMSQSFSIDK